MYLLCSALVGSDGCGGREGQGGHGGRNCRRTRQRIRPNLRQGGRRDLERLGEYFLVFFLSVISTAIIFSEER